MKITKLEIMRNGNKLLPEVKATLEGGEFKYFPLTKGMKESKVLSIGTIFVEMNVKVGYAGLLQQQENGAYLSKDVTIEGGWGNINIPKVVLPSIKIKDWGTLQPDGTRK